MNTRSIMRTAGTLELCVTPASAAGNREFWLSTFGITLSRRFFFQPYLEIFFENSRPASRPANARKSGWSHGIIRIPLLTTRVTTRLTSLVTSLVPNVCLFSDIACDGTLTAPVTDGD